MSPPRSRARWSPARPASMPTAARQARAGVDHESPRWSRPLQRAEGRAGGLRSRDARGRPLPRRRTSRPHSRMIPTTASPRPTQQRDTIGLQQLGDRGRRAPRPGRPILANDPHRAHERAVAALHRRTSMRPASRHRRRRAGAARHLDRPQRHHRVRPDDLRRSTRKTSTSTSSNPQIPNQYRYGSGWEPMRVVHETDRR